MKTKNLHSFSQFFLKIFIHPLFSSKGFQLFLCIRFVPLVNICCHLEVKKKNLSLAQTVKKLPARVPDSIPGLGRSPGEGNDYPLQYSCMENSMNRGAWQATDHRVAKSWT